MESHLLFYNINSPPLVIDMFKSGKLNQFLNENNIKYKKNELKYFLTHFHYDHYCGIGKTWSNIIYTSDITGILLEKILGINTKYIYKIQLNKVYNLFDFKFIFLDANHCPGSVIIVFEFTNGERILHTGDFRYHSKILKSLNITNSDSDLSDVDLFNESSSLDTKFEFNNIDTLILDTTFSLIREKFPPQRLAILDVIENVSNHLKESSEKCLFVFGSYLLGKERLYFSVAERFSMKIAFINPKQRNIISNLPLLPKYSSLITDLNYQISNDEVGLIHIVPMQLLGSTYPYFRPDLNWIINYKNQINESNFKFERIAAYIPSGWSHKFHMRSTHRNNAYAISVAYSEHSSTFEIEKFVSKIRPGRIIPSVYSNKNEFDKLDLMYRKYCTNEKSSKIIIGKRKRQQLLTEFIS